MEQGNCLSYAVIVTVLAKSIASNVMVPVLSGVKTVKVRVKRSALTVMGEDLRFVTNVMGKARKSATCVGAQEKRNVHIATEQAMRRVLGAGVRDMIPGVVLVLVAMDQAA